MPNVCGAPGDISLLILCQLKLMMVREETAEAEGPCNYYFLEPSEVQDPLQSLPTSTWRLTLSHCAVLPPAEWEVFFWNLKWEKVQSFSTHSLTLKRVGN